MIPPHIDVWDFQQDSTAALMHGQNPYTVHYRNIYGPGVDLGPGTVVDGWTTFSFPYPPLTLLLDIPGRLIGDVRWSESSCPRIRRHVDLPRVARSRAVHLPPRCFFSIHPRSS